MTQEQKAKELVDGNEFDYAIHILKCSLWEWESIKVTMEKNIAKNHPYQEACAAIDEANKKIPQLKRAIEQLEQTT